MKQHLKINDEKLIKLMENLEINKEKINELNTENEEYKKTQSTHNDEKDNKFLLLDNTIRGQQEEITFLNALLRDFKLRDSGIETASEAFDSDTDSFNKDLVNKETSQLLNITSMHN
ncbi:hypothetical protein [Spiroplasma endosymbiont of Nebria brevicollis]|uniref:hypothetical protein n=1 Tax=Spiroplasma endosymbiont of Nebria brevicollis TaxID=3066284 RepID=UPI00313DA39E